MKSIHILLLIFILTSCGDKSSTVKNESQKMSEYKVVDFKNLEFNYNNDAIYGDVVPLTFMGERDSYSIKQSISVQNSELTNTNFDDLEVLLLDNLSNVIDPVTTGLTITNKCNGVLARFRTCNISLELNITGPLLFTGTIKVKKGESFIDIPLSIEISDEYKNRTGVDNISLSTQTIDFNDIGALNSGVNYKKRVYVKNESSLTNYFSMDTSLVGNFVINTNCPFINEQYVLNRFRSCYVELSILSQESSNESGTLRLFSNEKDKTVSVNANIVTQVVDPTEENASIVLVSSEFFNHPSKMTSSSDEKELLAVFSLKNMSSNSLPLFYMNGSNLEYYGCPTNGASLMRFRTCNLHILGNKESIGHLSVNGVKYKINDSENDQLNYLLNSTTLLSGVNSQSLDLNTKNDYKLVLENFSLNSNVISVDSGTSLLPEAMVLNNSCSSELSSLGLCQISISMDPMMFNFGQLYTNSIFIDGEAFNYTIVGTSPCTDPSNPMYRQASRLNEDKTECVDQYGKFDSPDSTFGNVRFK